MQDEIKALKSELIAHRQHNPNKRSMPAGFWPRVKTLAKELSDKEIADALDIDLQNLRRRLGLQKSKQPPAQNSFVELPVTSSGSRKTVMKISVSDQVTIEVYS